LLSLGLAGTSRKADEHRLPVHPAHLERIEAPLRERIFLERGYGRRFGVDDEELARHVAGVRPREQLVEECDVLVLPKPVPEDLAAMPEGKTLWGWPHCVQDEQITQLAIDRRLTLIAWEAMNHWTSEDHFSLHVFHKNNELAGYCSVLHAMASIGIAGIYGRRMRAAVIGFGSTARGAVHSLNAHGIDDVRVLTNRDVAAVGSPIHSTQIIQMGPDPDAPNQILADTPDGVLPVADLLADNDIVVNCVLQDPDAPLVFVTDKDLAAFTPGSLIVDVACDVGMGFSWAEPTSFTQPIIQVANGIHYYAVDHSPSYLWDSATWEISEALLPHIDALLDGPATWDQTPTIARAIEIRDGVVVNPGILSFQHRDDAYPHARR
jgi:alanine dehydrogenase